MPRLVDPLGVQTGARAQAQRRRVAVGLGRQFVHRAVALTWAQAGLGVVLRSQWDVEHLVAQGKLVRLLADWEFVRADIVALVPGRHGNTQRVKACVEHLRAAFAKPVRQFNAVEER